MKCPFCIKICRKCKERIGEARLLVAYGGNFDKQKAGKYGFISQCKECIKAYKQSDKGKEAKAKYYQSDKGKQANAKGHAKYNKSDKAKQTQAKANAKFRQNNPEYSKQYWDKHLEELGLERSQGSIGEQKVRQVLTNMNIQFEEQYRFNDCKFKNTLPFDFYIPNLNIAIEYDGMQHFNIVEQFGGLDGFIDTIIRDTIKNDYCRRNNIRLIRIPYYEFNNIEQILSDLL